MKCPIPVVRVILKDDKRKILFLKRTSEIGRNQWSLPGGKVEFGQTLERACIDELKQETNLDLSGLKFLFYGENLPSSLNKTHWLVFYFTASYSGILKLNEESSDSCWIAVKNLYYYDVAFGHEDVVQTYFG